MPSGGGWRVLVEARGRKGFDVTGIGVSVPVWMYGRNPHGVPASSSHYIVQVLGERQMYYYEGGSLRRVFPVVFGKPSTPTPLGTFRVYSKTPGPGPAFGPLAMWYHRGYGIHGTNQEYLLTHKQRYYSLGCTRNYNDNIRWLYPRVPVGTPVRNIA
jgi:lipoprotein-anchoring transpeptidase ErfK/SrfK